MKKTLHNLAAGLHDKLLDGELDGEGRRWLIEHRAACRACDEAFGRMERLTHALAALDRPRPSLGFADRVLGQVRPAPLPIWARWRLGREWQRAAAVSLLVGGGLVAAALQLLVGSIVTDPGSVTLLFRWPELLGRGVVRLLDVVDPLAPFLEVASALGRAILTAASTPSAILALMGSALVSALALVELSKLLAPAPRRRLSDA